LLSFQRMMPLCLPHGPRLVGSCYSMVLLSPSFFIPLTWKGLLRFVSTKMLGPLASEFSRNFLAHSGTNWLFLPSHSLSYRSGQSRPRKEKTPSAREKIPSVLPRLAPFSEDGAIGNAGIHALLYLRPDVGFSCCALLPLDELSSRPTGS